MKIKDQEEEDIENKFDFEMTNSCQNKQNELL